MKKLFWVIAAVLTMLFSNLNAAGNQKAIIIFDASGSMWGQINGVPKIKIAKDALKKVVKSWNPDVQLGLTVYGHRRKGDCNDIESVVPVGAVDKGRIVKNVMAISPKGKTPISRSLKRAADELKFTEDKATVILISDGKETCDPDPCGTAKELKKQGIDFVAHVIGFNVDKATDKQLQCIANATGGEYFSAKNADALNKAMKSIVKKVEKPKKLEYNLQITASETKDSPKVEALHYIYKEGSKNYTQVCESRRDDPCLEHVAPGKYNIVTSYHHYKVTTPVEVISESNLTKVNVITGQTGQAKIFASETNGGKWVKSFHIIYKNIDGKKGENIITSCDSTKKKPCLERLPIGRYFVESTYNDFKSEASFEIKAGETTQVGVVFRQTGKVFVSASETEGGKRITAECRIYNEDKSNWSYIYPRKKEDSMSYKQLPVGKYYLNCEYNSFKKKDIPVEVKAGETTKVHIVFGQTGKVFVSASETEGGKRISAECRIYNEDKSDWSYIYPRKKEDSMSYKQLPTGKYFLNCQYNSFEKKDIPVEIKAGETTKVHIVFAPFHVKVKGITPCVKIHFEVIASDGQTVFEKDSPAYKGVDFVVSKGKYTIESSFGDKKINTKIDIGKGQNSATVDFGGDDTPYGIEGVWKTSEGRATIALNGKKVHGYYSSDNGELIGEMTYPKRFEGYWIEDNSNEKCSTAKNGRYHWGKIVWEFDKNMCSFKGKWSYCNKTPNSGWDGSYIRPLNEDDRHKLLIKDDVSSNSKAETKTAPKEESQNSKETNKNNPKTIKIGDKVINIEGLSDEKIKKLKDMQKMLEMFGKKQ